MFLPLLFLLTFRFYEICQMHVVYLLFLHFSTALLSQLVGVSRGEIEEPCLQ
jgi:hypothetical protein